MIIFNFFRWKIRDRKSVPSICFPATSDAVVFSAFALVSVGANNPLVY